jgi:hypothetical protein
MEENSKRFKLVYNSLILHRDILEAIGIKGKMEPSNLLVHYGIMVLSVSSNITSFLHLLYQPSQVSINNLILKVEWNAHWNSYKERTSLSKSGLHYGHYLAHC